MMIPHPYSRHLTQVAAGAFLCLAAALPVHASAASEAQARFRQDMAVCNSGQSSQAPATCRLEARHALAEAKRGGLDDAPGQYKGNAMQRCGNLQGNDRSDCEARMRGVGRSEGSVEGGGIIRETITVVPGK